MQSLKTVLNNGFVILGLILFIIAASGAIGYVICRDKYEDKMNNALETIIKMEKNNEQLNKEIEVLNADKAVVVKEREDLKVKLKDSNDKLAELENAEPSQPELENEPLVINLRMRLKEQDRRYSLALEDIAKADKIIADMQGIADKLNAIITNKNTVYSVLLVNYNSLQDDYTKLKIDKIKLESKYKTTRNIVIGSAVVFVAYEVIKMVLK